MLSFIYTGELAELNGDNAMAVLTPALRWADAKCRQNCIERSAGNRRAVLGPALFKIRFPLIPNDEFSKKIGLSKNWLGTDNNEKWMGFYLLCDGPKEAQNCSFECSATFRIVSQKKDVPDFKDEFNDQLLNNKLSWEFFHSISFDELMDEKQFAIFYSLKLNMMA
ncbi:hypothetical protein niasHS_009506 [Heterodera schachtii]|uniref:Uncharacterized protein n=1 Tax=Heterodera schachtii TaxID=97005 RepID=A0ABD2J4C1_HETSC